MVQDLRYAFRVLRRAPGFTVVAVCALALGIAANTAIFSVVNAVLLQPLPYRDPSRLALIWEHNLPRDRKNNVVSPGNYLHWREMNRVFDDLAAVGTFRTTMSGKGEPQELSVQYTTAGLFPLLGVPVQRGRWFTAEDEAPNVNVTILSDRVWRQRFGADPGVVNSTVTLDGVAHTVVGIMPPSFSVFSPGLTSTDLRVDLWVPIGFTAASRTPRGRWMTVYGRVKPGVTFDQAQADMTRVHAELTTMFPAFNTGWTARVVPVQEELTGSLRPALLVMAGAVGFVLLIACANVGNLLLARATSRTREMAVRAAMGASRARLIRQMLMESAVLGAAGGTAGLLLAWWGVVALRAAITGAVSLPVSAPIGIDLRVLLFTLSVSAASAIVFGLLPALSSSGPRLAAAMKDGGRSGSAGRTARTRNAFVVVEVALSLVLLVGAGLLVRSFVALLHVDRGFDPAQTVTMKVSIPSSTYKTPEAVRGFFDQLMTRLDALPGVEAAGGTSFLPLAGMGAATGLEIVGKPKPPAGQEPVTDVRVVTHHYFEAMRIPLVRGRFFDARDAAAGGRRVIVTESLAKRYFPGEDPIGKQIIVSWNDPGKDEIVGVVGDVRQQTLEDEARPCIYWPPARFSYPFMTVAIRTSTDPRTVVAAAIGRLHELNPVVAAADVRTMADVVDSSVAQRRVTMLLLVVFAALALVLAAVGIYGVISYSVAQRTQEIGIRMALGAPRGAVLRMVVGQAMGLALGGVVTGAAGALALSRLMQKLLFGVPAWDPVTFVAVAALLAAVAAMAASVPGLRATRVDPVVALRSE